VYLLLGNWWLLIVILSGVGCPIRVKFGKDVGLELLWRGERGAIALLNIKIDSLFPVQHSQVWY
jgi:hypothetical protein